MSKNRRIGIQEREILDAIAEKRAPSQPAITWLWDGRENSRGADKQALRAAWTEMADEHGVRRPASAFEFQEWVDDFEHRAFMRDIELKARRADLIAAPGIHPEMADEELSDAERADIANCIALLLPIPSRDEILWKRKRRARGYQPEQHFNEQLTPEMRAAGLGDRRRKDGRW